LTTRDAALLSEPTAPAEATPAAGLYVHWPFCRAKCPYCDFNSHVRDAVDHDRWRLALVRELTATAERVDRCGPLGSIFFGGGTPSLMAPATVAAVIDAAAARFGLADDVEISLEANPTSVESGKFRAFADAGVNRVSLGVQSLDDRALRFLGRQHSAAEALAAVDLAQRWFARTSFDLIYARAGQSADDWASELAAALRHAGGHISLYQLTIEPGTRFHALWQAGRLPVLDDDRQAALYEQTVTVLAAHRFEAYEVSNFAKPGEACRHNLVYWRSGPYLGIGPGAHGRLLVGGQRLATANERSPERWLEAVRRHGHGRLSEQPLTAREQLVEALMMGLRLSEGVPLARLRAIAGDRWLDALDSSGLARARRHGWIELTSERLTATASGRRLLDSLLVEILD